MAAVKLPSEPAAGRHVLEREADLGRERARMLEEPADGARFLVARPVEAARDLEDRVLVIGLQRQHPRDRLVADLRVRHAHVDLGRGMVGDHIGARAALDHADIDGDARGVIRHRLEIEDLARQLLDGAASVLMPRARMGQASGDAEVEAGRSLARRHHLAAFARRLRHQHVLRALRLSLDEGARGRAADLLVRDEEMADRQRRPSPEAIRWRSAAKAMSAPPFMS